MVSIMTKKFAILFTGSLLISVVLVMPFFTISGAPTEQDQRATSYYHVYTEIAATSNALMRQLNITPIPIETLLAIYGNEDAIRNAFPSLYGQSSSSRSSRATLAPHRTITPRVTATSSRNSGAAQSAIEATAEATATPTSTRRSNVASSSSSSSSLSSRSSGNNTASTGRIRTVEEREGEFIEWINGVNDVTLKLTIVWIFSLLALVFVGNSLNQIAIGAVQRAYARRKLVVTAGEKGVLWLSHLLVNTMVIYFYVSIAMLILLCLVLGLNVNRFILRFNWFTLGILMVTLWGYYHIIRALLSGLRVRRANDRISGRFLKRDDAPELWTIVETVAQKLKTRPIEFIYLLPDALVSVGELGGLYERWAGRGERTLLLGAGVLNTLTTPELEAIIAHEYGHFKNREFFSSPTPRQTQQKMQRMAFEFRRLENNHWLNPAWVFLRIFYAIFTIISYGISRLQEVLADRYAAMNYGRDTFINGLVKIARQSIAHDYQAQKEINEALKESRDFNNLFDLSPLDDTDSAKLDMFLSQLMARETSRYDMHPPLGVRVGLLQAMDDTHLPSEEDERPSWELFNDPLGLQLELTKMVQEDVKRRQQFMTFLKNLARKPAHGYR